MSEKELEAKMAKILDDHKGLINVSPEESQPKSETEQLLYPIKELIYFYPKAFIKARVFLYFHILLLVSLALLQAV
ncbi:MAG: hypothetical protein CM15mV103_420 [uncultured marine virus]|nr:MAG: hypothetical protein CM15mV103_420 [uncultured marine virus]